VLLAALLTSAGSLAAGRFEHGLLWKIEPPGAEPSYLFGTMHSEDPAVLHLPGPVRRAFEAASGVTLEVVLDPASLVMMTSAFMLNDGSNLKQHIGAPLYRRAVQAMAGYGMPEAMVSGMKPWAVAVTLMTPPSESGMVLDLMLYQQALAAGKPVDGLETPMEQLDVFDALSPQDQVAMLEDTLDNLDDMQRMLDQLKFAYLARDLRRLVEIGDESMASLHESDPERAQRFTDRLITERNHRMAERMQSRLATGRQFIAVGALHLPGEEGLLSLLSGKGYRVTMVY
jgi:uncharacterized protein YbaP (TraB family)